MAVPEQPSALKSKQPVGTICEPCKKWQVQLLDLNGKAITGKTYKFINPETYRTVTGKLDSEGKTKEYPNPSIGPFIDDGKKSILFPDLKILPDISKLRSHWVGGGADALEGDEEKEKAQLAKEVGSSVGANVNKKVYTNTCAIRASNAFNRLKTDFIPYVGKVDISIPGSSELGKIPSQQTEAKHPRSFSGTGQNANIIISAEEFKDYLKYKYPDAPFKAIPKSASSNSDIKGIPSFVNRRKGRSIHVDNWDGKSLKANDDMFDDDDATNVDIFQWVVIGYKKSVKQQD